MLNYGLVAIFLLELIPVILGDDRAFLGDNRRNRGGLLNQNGIVGIARPGRFSDMALGPDGSDLIGSDAFDGQIAAEGILSTQEEGHGGDENEDGSHWRTSSVREAHSLGDVLTPAGMSRQVLRSLLQSVLRIHVTRASPDFGFPWRMLAEERGTGSGFPIVGRRIITNAHVVADHRVIEVTRPGSASRFAARVIAVAHEPDLAILTIDDDEFWDGVPILSLVKGPLQMTIPAILSEVLVIGYPTGGDTLSVTKGVVNRAEVGVYAHSNSSLLHVQIDAAINPGNSGGPAVTMDGEVIGVAFQGLRSADSIGYIIPAGLVDQLLTDLDVHGKYTGIAQLGITVQELRNDTLKHFLGLPATMDADTPNSRRYENGCLVISVDGSNGIQGETAGGQIMDGSLREIEEPGAIEKEGAQPHGGKAIAASQVGSSGDKEGSSEMDAQDDKGGLRRRDVLLRLDGEDVAQDCTVSFRDSERLSLGSLLIGLFSGEVRNAVVLRDNEVISVETPLVCPKFVVPTHTEGMSPRYIIFGGLVFVPLTAAYILNFKSGSHRVQLSTLAKKYQTVFRTDALQEVVVLSRILSSSLTRGYDFQNQVVESINGTPVKNLQHLHDLLFLSDAASLDIGFGEHGQFLVIDRLAAVEENPKILTENKIVSPTSPTLDLP